MSTPETLQPRNKYIDGFPLPDIGSKFTEKSLNYVKNFSFKEEDFVVASYPRSGSTWTQFILWSVVHSEKTELPSIDSLVDGVCPFMDGEGAEVLETMPSPRLMKSNLPPTILPVVSPAKFIVLVRNPWDVCVSYFEFVRQIPDVGFLNGPFDSFFELFLQGDMAFGDYFDNVRSWYRLKDEPNVLLLKYEYLKSQTEEGIAKIASFLGKKYEEQVAKNPEVLKRIVQAVNFSNLKKAAGEKLTVSDSSVTFFRKGIVGDWKNYFSADQKKRLDEKFIKLLNGTDIYTWYENMLGYD